MKTGIIEIRFTEATSDDDIREMIADFYNDNKLGIEGMEFSQLKSEKDLLDCHKAINETLSINNSNPQSKLDAYAVTDEQEKKE